MGVSFNVFGLSGCRPQQETLASGRTLLTFPSTENIGYYRDTIPILRFLVLHVFARGRVPDPRFDRQTQDQLQKCCRPDPESKQRGGTT